MRIVGGEFRSRTLVAPRGQETRPTSDRVREALFSMLASDGVFDDGPARVLDLYAGSGALGLEALSRGAGSVVLVENGKAALAAIRENVEALGVVDQVTVVAMRVDRALSLGHVDGPFDLVLMDPPYRDVRDRGFFQVLEAATRLLAASGTLVLEHASADKPGRASGLMLDRSRRHGDTTLSLFRKGPHPTDESG